MRQYIGARYVPKFMGTYDATQVYEALCVVDNGLGTSYISTVPTPANTPLTDTNYWAIYGASSGAIISLQNQIDDMNDGSVAGSLQNQINEMQDGTVSGSLQDQINDLETQIQDRTLLNKQIALYSDSYGNPSNPFAAAWVNALSAYSGHTVHNVSASGRTMNMIQLAFDGYADADLYLVVGGLNDWNNTADLDSFKTAITNMVNNIRTAKADAEIMFMTPPIAHHDPGSGITVYYPLDYYRQVMWQTCEELHVMVCSGISIDGLNMESDGIHPTVSTAPRMTDAIIRAYEAGGDTRDYHDEYIQNESNTYVLSCIGGSPFLQVSDTMTFTSGGASKTLSYLNNSKLLYYPKAYGWRREASGVYQWFLTSNATGITVSVQRQSTEDGTFSGTVGIYSNLIPLALKGMLTENS